MCSNTVQGYSNVVWRSSKRKEGNEELSGEMNGKAQDPTATPDATPAATGDTILATNAATATPATTTGATQAAAASAQPIAAPAETATTGTATTTSAQDLLQTLNAQLAALGLTNAEIQAFDEAAKADPAVQPRGIPGSGQSITSVGRTIRHPGVFRIHFRHWRNEWGRHRRTSS